MEKPQTVVPQLPDIVLRNILSFKTNERNVRLVCRNFKSIFDWNIGVNWGKNAEALDHELEELETFDELPCCRSFRLCSSNESQKVVTIPKFRSKHLLNNIWLRAQVTNSSLSQTLTGLTALTTLKISEQGITNFTCYTCLKDLINLEKLAISMRQTERNALDTSLISFLNNAKFPNLENLKIVLDEQPICENKFCGALLGFLIQHQDELYNLELKLMHATINNNDDLPDLPDFELQLTELECSRLLRLVTYQHGGIRKFTQICDQILMQGKMIMVADEIPFTGEIALSRYPTFQYYINMNEIPQKMLTNNSETLVKIGLSLFPTDCQPLDSSIFAPCTTLKELRLLTLQNSDAEITNLDALPSTLERLGIYNLQIKSEEIHSLALRRPGLTYVHFANCGTTNGYGVTFESYLSFTSGRSTKKTFHIIDSWNIPDLMESLHNRGPHHRLIAISLLVTKNVELKNRKKGHQLPQKAQVVLKPILFRSVSSFHH